MPPLVVAALSTTALVLVLSHRRANLGNRATLLFLVAAVVYGWVRSITVRALSESLLGGAPYRLGAPFASVVGAPLQELIGWISAVGLAGYCADRLLRRGGYSADPWSTALAAGLGLAAVCLAVETAAVSGGWWAWSLGHATTGALRFPAIALVDWGFVAIDFLLPFELFRRRAPFGQRIAGLLLFPLHLAGHALTSPLSRAVPLSGFELIHVGLLAAVAAGAAGATSATSAAWGASPWPATSRERLRPVPLLAALVIVAATTSQLLLVGEWTLLWSGIPLAALAWVAAAVRVGSPVRPAAPGRRRAAWVFVTVMGLGLCLRLPVAIRAQQFETLLGRGVAALAAGDLEGARAYLVAALARRPAQPDASWLLGWAEMQSGRRAAARVHLETAVAHRLASVEAVRFLALLELEEGRRREARLLLERRRARHQEPRDLVYLAWAAAAGRSFAGPAPAALLEAASPAELREIFALAKALGDLPTMTACRQLAREASAPDGGSSVAP